MDQVNTLISAGFEDFRPAAVRCTRYRIAKFVKLKLLKPNAEFLKWNITPPPDFKVDRNGDKTDIDMVRAGADNMPNVMRRNGLRARKSLTEQAKFVKDQQDIAAKYGVPVESLGNLSIPGMLPPAAAEADPNAPENADTKKDSNA
jgi:hypothetical protein